MSMWGEIMAMAAPDYRDGFCGDPRGRKPVYRWKCHHCGDRLSGRAAHRHGPECPMAGLPGFGQRDPRRIECLECGERMGLYAARSHAGKCPGKAGAGERVGTR